MKSETSRVVLVKDADSKTPGSKIQLKHGRLIVPDNPLISFIEGDGIGAEIWDATRKVVDAAVAESYHKNRRICWHEVLAGDKAVESHGTPLPPETVSTIAENLIAIKGPLGTPTGGGIRSINVALRQRLDLYQCIRPFRHYQGVPSVLKEPGKLDVVIFRENTEDVYSGIEFKAGSRKARKLAGVLREMGAEIAPGSGIGIKPISKLRSKRLIRAAIRFALENNRPSVTIVHKGNIQKFTEGAFCQWGYEVAEKEFGERTISESRLWQEFGGKLPAGRLLVKDRIADAMFMELLLRPSEHSVIATTNLNGDYLSDQCAAQVGGLGLAPGANIGKHIAIFEATHGTAPTIAGKGLANPGSLMLSAKMLLDHIGWSEAGQLLEKALAATIASGIVTSDLAPGIPGSKQVTTGEFADAIIEQMTGP